jgi:hypothetical protein
MQPSSQPYHNPTLLPASNPSRQPLLPPSRLPSEYSSICATNRFTFSKTIQ